MINEILSTVKILKGIIGADKDGLLKLHIDMAAQSVLNYCNINTLPNELKYVVANMVIEAMEDKEWGDTNAPVSSVSEQGASVSFDMTAYNAKLADCISKTTELNRYRQLYKTKPRAM